MNVKQSSREQGFPGLCPGFWQGLHMRVSLSLRISLKIRRVHLVALSVAPFVSLSLSLTLPFLFSRSRGP